VGSEMCIRDRVRAIESDSLRIVSPFGRYCDPDSNNT
jgi:hypothetical protein